jgi:hypothetical protein
MEHFKINEVEKRTIEQVRYKLMYDRRNYTFTDYVYADSGEPVASGEFASLVDNQGNTVKDQKVFDAIVEYIVKESFEE